MKRLGIIGAGGQGRRRAEEIGAAEGAALVGVASRSLASAQKLAQEFGAERATSDYAEMADWSLDALVIATPNSSHYQLTRWGLEHNLDILVEGPVCTQISHALELERLAMEKGLLVEVGYNSVYHPLFEVAREAIAQGAIGRPVLARAAALWKTPPDSWYYSQELSGGMPLAHLSYTFNRMRYLMGRPVELMARANQLARQGEGWVREETCAVIFTFASGALGAVMASFVMDERLPDEGIRVIGTEGSLWAAFDHLSISNQEFERSIALAPGGPPPRHLQMRAFIGNLETRQEGRNPISDAVLDIKVAQAIAESSQTGRAVSLE